ncbi:hypothetical protein TNCV_4594721 [Trichonephila clavipes]|uniref:Uncharacterized protein n=1 Tax=Trichonephila clavipes TaxID=2585209 RepID=A0A8X6WFB1_TRICX|nr:hypothetical protein TNCV_4594721 [Trichonephila clavipes]
MLPVLGKKAVLEWCMKEGLIGSSYACPKCGKSIELRERRNHIILPSVPGLRVSKAVNNEMTFAFKVESFISETTKTVSSTFDAQKMKLRMLQQKE